MNRVEITTFGGLQIRSEKAQPKTRLSKALLAYLAAATRPIQRSHLADLLWDASKVRNPRHSLSQTLYDLRHCLPENTLICDASTVSLNSERVTVDIIEFTAALQADDLARATSLYRGAFLDQFPYITDAYDDWRIETTGLTHSEAMTAFKSLLFQQVDAGDYAAAALTAKTALVVDPSDATLVRVRVEALAAAGDVARALRELELARSRLRLEYGHIPKDLGDELGAAIARLVTVEASRQTSSTFHVRLIGRAKELELVKRHWRPATRTLKSIGISGPPGIGKSRLLDHILRRFVLDGIRVFGCRCSEAEVRLPYGAAVNILREGLRSSDLQRLPPVWKSILATIAPELLPDAAPAHGCSQRSLWAAITYLLAELAADSPIVIGIDNYHWADEVSKDLLQFMAAELAEASVLIVISQRAYGMPPVASRDTANHLEVRLGELSVDHTLELIRVTEEQYGFVMTDSLRHAMVRGIGGHPFFMLEALRHVSRTVPTQVPSVVELALTRDVERSLHGRLLSVSAEGRKVLDTLAVLNRAAPLHFIARIAGLGPREATDAVDALASQGLITDSEHVGFAHDILLEYRRRRLRPSDKVMWHTRIADALAQSPESNCDEIAHHYELGKQPQNAFEYAVKAKEQALVLHAPAEAEAQYHRMLRCSSGSKRVSAEAEYALWLAKSGRMKDVLPYARKLKQYAAADHNVQLLVRLAEFEELETEARDSGVGLLDQALQIVRYCEQHTPNLIPSVLWQVTDTLRRQRAFGTIAELARTTIDRSAAASTELATELLTVSALLVAISRGHRRGLRVAQAALQVADGMRDPILLAKALFARGTINLWAGRITEAGDDYQRLRNVADPVGPDSLLARMRSNSSVLLLEQNRLDEAERQATLALAETPLARKGYVHGNLALIALAKHDFSRALLHANELMEWSTAARHDWIPVHAHALAGLAHLLAGEWGAAERRAHHVSESIHLAAGIMDTSHAHILIARVTARAGAPQAALAHLRQVTVDVRTRDCLAGARLHLEQARLLGHLGSDHLASSLARTVRDVAMKRGALLLAEGARSLM